jgi:actin-like ATPase involved in cell morphogenesis
VLLIEEVVTAAIIAILPNSEAMAWVVDISDGFTEMSVIF